MRLVDGIALTSSLIVLGALAGAGVGLSFVGLPERTPKSDS